MAKGNVEVTTTKHCPKCGNTHLVLLSSQNQKLCTDCGAVLVWRREKGESTYR
jgi:ribosomal protein S27E